MALLAKICINKSFFVPEKQADYKVHWATPVSKKWGGGAHEECMVNEHAWCKAIPPPPPPRLWHSLDLPSASGVKHLQKVNLEISA